MTGGTPLDVSVVVPTYNGQHGLAALCRRVAATLNAGGWRWELLLVDDASPDDTALQMPLLQRAHPQLRYLRQAVNVGQHRATVLGLAAAEGLVVVTMDDDLQQAPESIPLLLAALKPGVQVAVGRFERPAHAAWRRLGSRLLALTLQRARQGEPVPLAITSFKAFRRDAARHVVAQVPDGPFYLAKVMLACLPRDSLVNVSVPHHARLHGRSNYGPLRLLRLAWQALRGRVRRGRVV